MPGEDGKELKVEKDMVEETKALGPKERAEAFWEMVHQAQDAFGIVLVIVSNNINPGYMVSQIQAVPKENIQQR